MDTLEPVLLLNGKFSIAKISVIFIFEFFMRLIGFFKVQWSVLLSWSEKGSTSEELKPVLKRLRRRVNRSERLYYTVTQKP